jgi:hypothetical protein
MSDDQTRLFLTRAAVVSFLLTIFMHILPPLPFAQTQMLFDYSHGLVRRGLVGSILNGIFGHDVSLAESFLAAFLLNLLAAVTLFATAYALLHKTIAALMVLTLLACSYAFATFISNSGYLDTVLIILALFAILISSTGMIGFILGLLAVVLAVLTHENAVPYFTVLIGFSLWLSGDRTMSARSFLRAASPILAGVGTVIILALFGQMTPEISTSFAIYIEGLAQFNIDSDATDIAGRSLSKNFAHMAEIRANGSYWIWLLFDGGLLAGMSAFLIWLNACILKGENKWTFLAMIGAIVAPLTLNIIAFDIARFGAISVINGFLCIGLILRYVNGASERLTQTLQWPIFVFVLVLNLQVATMQLNQGIGHTTRFPYVIKHQLDWMLIPQQKAE